MNNEQKRELVIIMEQLDVFEQHVFNLINEKLEFQHKLDQMEMYGTHWAAANGHLDCLVYAHEHDYPWDELTCVCAAHYGHLECLRYVHEHGCPWDERTLQRALATSNYHCFCYAIKNKCPGWEKYDYVLNQSLVGELIKKHYNF
jgi:hypothetical protein